MLKLNGLFKKTKYITVSSEVLNKIENNENPEDIMKPNIPNGMWVKCPKCNGILYKKDLEAHFMTCYHCGNHLRMNAKDRLNLIIDEDSFEEYDGELKSGNPLDFQGYSEKINKLTEETGLEDAVITGKGRINGETVVIAIMDSNFMMGSMGSVVGEKITRAIERATEEKLPIIIFTTSGGARMQEGMFSLMQMAKTSAAIAKHSQQGLLYITVLTDPTTGGVTASFAMLGDIILSEPGALIGFAGKRVIESTINEKLPEGFQRAEFLLEHGFIDKIVHREKLKDTLSEAISLHSYAEKPIENDVEITQIEKEKTSLNAWEKVKLARHNLRPTALDYIENVFDSFIEFHGDRYFGEDSSIVCGVAMLNNTPVTVIAQAKGRNTKENIQRNFAMPKPEGYRKALRMMKQAEKFNRPIICFVDTPGAYPGLGAEERGQGEAIARNLMEMSQLKVPIISIVIGEGGSGGALALSVSDKIAMLENSIYSVLSPEGFASILWKDASRAEEAAAIMKLTAEDLKENQIIDDIISEPKGGAQNDADVVSSLIKSYCINKLNELLDYSKEELIENRYDKYRNIGKFYK